MEKKMEGVEAILKRFGDEQSALLDRFERHSFEVQLNQAILGRSLSEPTVPRTTTTQPPPPVLVAPPPPMKAQVHQGRRRRGSGLKKVLKRLLNPILRRKGGGTKEVVPDPNDPRFWKAFSRSMRV